MSHINKALKDLAEIRDKQTLEERIRSAKLRSLYVVCGVHMVAMMMLMDAKFIVYMKHFKGDAAKVARASALGMSMMTLIGIFTTPMLSALSDLHGRKVLLLLSPLWSLACRIAEIAHPTALVIQTTTALTAFGMANMQGTRTSIGDLFPDDAKGAGGALAAMQACPLVAAAVGPHLGGFLAARDVRLPFAFAALLSAIEVLLVHYWVPETRPQMLESNRVDGIWDKVNPLRFLVLFTRGPQLSLLAFSQFLSELTEPQLLAQNRAIITTSTLGWGIAERARFMSWSAVINAPGYAMAGKVSKRLGARVALLTGSVAVILQNLAEAFVTKGWQQFSVLALGLPRGTGTAALSSLLMEAAAAAGIGQAELQGSLQSLQQLTMAIAFPLWARVCSACLGAGKPRRFYLVVAAVAGARLLISQYASLLDTGRNKGAAAA